MTPLFVFEIGTFLQLALALALGMLLGAERTMAGKSAGLRTYGLVSMGSALFVIISVAVTPYFATYTNADPIRIISAVISGMGFLGAGLIIFREQDAAITGLTTAAGLWIAAGIGMAVGYQLYTVALSVAVLTLVVFTAAWQLEEEVREIGHLPDKKGGQKKIKKTKTRTQKQK